VEAFRQAVTIDPEFALAWYRLSVAALWSRQAETAWEAARKAVEHGHRLSDRDRELLDAFHALLRGANEEAERRYQSIVGTHPNDAEAWFQLGELQFHSGPLRGRSVAESRHAWERLLRLDPRHLSAIVHLVIIAASAGDLDELEVSARRALKLSPEGDSAAWMSALRYFARGGEDDRERAIDELRQASDHSVTWAARFVGANLRNLPGARKIACLLTEPVRSPEVRALGYVYLAHLELARGRWNAAQARLASAGSLHDPCFVEYGALFAASPFHPIATQEVKRMFHRVARWDPGSFRPGPGAHEWLTPHEGIYVPLREYLMGLLHARLGAADSAAACAGRLEEWDGPPEAQSLVRDLALSVRAQAAVARGAHGDALKLLEEIRMEVSFYLTLWSPFYSEAYERFARAELLHKAGRYEEAYDWYGSFADTSLFELIYLAPSHLRRGEILEHLGRPADAAEHYTRFADLWEECDTHFRGLLDGAKARLREL